MCYCQGGFNHTHVQMTNVTVINNHNHHGSGGYCPAHNPHPVCCHRPHGVIGPEDWSYDSDSSDDTVVGNFANMRVGGPTDSQSTVRKPQPRAIEMPDSRSRASSRPSGAQYSTHSRANDSRPSTREDSRRTESRHSNSRPAESHRRSTQSSSRPSESRYLTASAHRDSHEPSSRTSHRPSESHYAVARRTDSHRGGTATSTRPSDSRTYGAGKEVTVYAEPSSKDKRSSDKSKSDRRESKSVKAVKALVKHI